MAGDLTVDYDKHQVLIGGENMKLTQNGFRIVALLSHYAGKVLTYGYIMKELWGTSERRREPDPAGEHGQHRPKVEKNLHEPQVIFPEVGVGFMLEGRGPPNPTKRNQTSFLRRLSEKGGAS